MKYFDKTFWKMFCGFAALIVVSLTILFAVKVYEEKSVSSASLIARPH